MKLKYWPKLLPSGLSSTVAPAHKLAEPLLKSCSWKFAAIAVYFQRRQLEACQLLAASTIFFTRKGDPQTPRVYEAIPAVGMCAKVN